MDNTSWTTLQDWTTLQEIGQHFNQNFAIGSSIRKQEGPLLAHHFSRKPDFSWFQGSSLVILLDSIGYNFGDFCWIGHRLEFRQLVRATLGQPQNLRPIKSMMNYRSTLRLRTVIPGSLKPIQEVLRPSLGVFRLSWECIGYLMRLNIGLQMIFGDVQQGRKHWADRAASNNQDERFCRVDH